MRTISELSAEANSYEFFPQIPFPKWVHTCSALLRESRVYDREGDPAGREHAYVLYLRFADLVLNKLCTHPAFQKHKKVWSQLAGMVPDAIERSTVLKQQIVAAAADAAGDARHARPNPLRTGLPAEDGDDFIARELRRYEEGDLHSASVNIDPTVLSAVQRLHRQHEAPNRPPPLQPPPLQRPAQPSPVGAPPLLAAPAVASGSGGGSKGEIASVYTTERGKDLRYVFVPRSLRARFLAIADANTAQNLETCGMLCGRLQRNAFFVTDLVVPHQESTADSCGTTNEEELFSYVDERDLFIVGWIHTHPTQTCFMSSVDLHTHAAYQLMLPESVAVVCAPRATPDWNAFRLTDPPGMDVIRNCVLPGFHPHDNAESLYCVPGHYKEYDFELTAVDLRKRSL